MSIPRRPPLSRPVAVVCAALFVAIGCSGAGGDSANVALTPIQGAPTDVANYAIDARLDANHRVITATETLHWVNTSSQPVRELWWHLYMNAFANPDTLFMRTGGNEGHRGNLPGAPGRIDVLSLRASTGEDLLPRAENDPSVPNDTTQLRTPLAAPVLPGQSVDAVVSFRTTLPDAFARAGTWRDFTFAGQWFPKIAVLRNDGRWAHFPFHANTEFFADFGHYDVVLRVPHGDVVGATGVETESRSEATADVHRFRADSVHDFAWTSWQQFGERVDRIDGIRVRTLYPPGTGSVAARAVDTLRWAMPDFRQRFGTYPYPQLTVVLAPRQAHGVGGMEYPTLITIDGEWFEPSSERNIEWVTVHEYAHQYFYGLLASDEWSWPFLDEGFADYASGLAMGAHLGVDREFFDALGFTLGYWAFESGFAADIDDNIPVAAGSSRYPDYFSYSQHVYRRAATLLRTAERSYGRAAMRNVFTLYTTRMRFRHPDPEDFLAAARDSGSPGIEPFLRYGLFRDSNLDLTLTDKGALEYEGVPDLPVELRIDRTAGDENRTIQETPGIRNIGPLGRNFVRAHVDLDEHVDLDRNRLDNAIGRHGSSPRGAPLEAFVTVAMEAIARIVGP